MIFPENGERRLLQKTLPFHVQSHEILVEWTRLSVSAPSRTERAGMLCLIPLENSNNIRKTDFFRRS